MEQCHVLDKQGVSGRQSAEWATLECSWLVGKGATEEIAQGGAAVGVHVDTTAALTTAAGSGKKYVVIRCQSNNRYIAKGGDDWLMALASPPSGGIEGGGKDLLAMIYEVSPPP
jgi:hypothetical protein